MSPKFPDDNEMEEETVHKKRARRVSFAETTAVHFFNRDDESESTPDNASKEELSSGNLKLSRTESDEIKDLLQSSSSSSSGDDSDGDDDVEAVIKSAFLRPFESPSSGSCFGSATSNDEDNFFGPVSANFIRPGRLSDSAISDENHEVTMDSTAFSMNFRSLARSDSGGEFKTPTGVRVPFGERTPGAASSEASLGDLMVLTGNGNRISHSPLPVTKVNDSGNSDDMSLVGTHDHKYDYGQLPPEFDVFLAEGNGNLEAMSLNGDIEFSNAMGASNPKRSHDLSGCDNFEQTDSRDAGSVHKNEFLEISAEATSVDLLNVEKGNGDISDATLGETTQSHSKEVDDGPGSITPINEHIQATFLQTHDVSLEKDSNGRIGSIPGSISSLLSKRRQIFKDPSGLENALLNSPHGDKVFRVKGNRGWSTSVFAKSVSRLKRLETSFLSASKFEGNASRLRVHELSPRHLERDNNMEYVSTDISFTRFDAPVACLDVRFAESDEQLERESDRDNYDLKNTGIVQSEGCIEVDKDENFSGLCKSSPSPKTSAKRLVSSSTASLETGSLDCKTKGSHESELETPAVKTVQSMQSDSSVLDITFNDSKDSIDTVMFGNIGCSPASGVVNKVSASPLYGGSPFMFNLDQQGQKERDDLASTVENYSSSLAENKSKSNLSACDIDHQFSNPAEPHLKDKVLKSHNVISSNNKVETGRTFTSCTMDLPVQRVQSIPGCTLSSDARSHELPVQVLDNSTEKQVCSMTLNVTRDLSDDAEVNFSEGQCDAPLDKLISNNEDSQLLLESFDICASDGPLSHKRKLFDEIQDHDDHDLLPRKPKLCKDQKNYEEEHKGPHCVETDLASRDWADVFTSFCGVTKQQLIPISDKFDVALIAKLDDVLVHLGKLKSYELLHHEKSLDSAHFLRSKRVADTKLLLYKTLYQKAKLQLVRLKRDKLLDHTSRMKSRVDESEKIMSSCDLISKQSGTGQIGCFQLERHFTDTDNRNLVSAELCSLRKKLKDSEGEIRKLNKSFYSYIKDMKEPTSTETAAYVKSSLKKMVACQSLQSEMQLCKVERLEAIHGQPNIMFDHGGFLLQSFITKSTSTSGLLLANKLNKEKISKMFINDMDAHSAFSFVLSGDMQLTYEGLRTIAEQTQKAVSRLHILLDVMEEVQLAKMELKSLTRARFCQPSAGKLDLQLCFTDFRSGARVTLTIDITCLNRGVYPSEILPYEVQGITARNQDIFESLVEDIRTAVQGVRSGFMRIIRICRCVSRMIETGGMTNAGDMH